MISVCLAVIVSVAGVVVSTVAWHVTAAGAQPSFDVERYQPRKLTDVLARHPSTPGVTILRDVPVRAAVIYSGEFRELSVDSHRVIRAWSTAMEVPIAGTVFRREVLVHEGGDAFWLPVQETLGAEMHDELDRGDSIDVFAVYIGQVDGHHVFLVNAFDHKGPHRPRRRT